MRIAACLLLVACSSSAGPASPSEIAAFSTFSNLIPVQATLGGATGWTYVDTGDPTAHADGSVFGAVKDPSSTVSISIDNRSYGQIDVFEEPLIDLHLDPSLPIVGVLGCSLTCTHVTGLNYRDFALELDPSAPPSGIGADTAVDFELEGGHDPMNPAPASRVVVTVMIEGTPYRMLVDSGAQHVAVTKPVFDALIADQRATTTLQDISGAVYGQTPYVETRAQAIVVGGVELDDVVVAQADAFDAKLQSLSTDAGETIDGSLGGTFLHAFYVTIDYAGSKVHFAPYNDPSWAIDPAHSIGAQIGLDADRNFAVIAVTPAASAQGIAIGDLVTAIDGKSLSADLAFQALASVYGAVGDSKTVTFGQAASAAVATKTLTLVVEEWLPL